MLKACAKAVERLWKISGQVAGLCTLYTMELSFRFCDFGLYTKNRTVFAQFYCSFTQACERIFNLMTAYFYPFSTLPMTITNLIKE
jgi:hypothetical protein